MRTTLDIDDPVLRDLKRLQRREGKSLGRLVSDLLAIALAQVSARKPVKTTFRWISQPLKPRVDLADRDALYTVMEEKPSAPNRKGSKR